MKNQFKLLTLAASAAMMFTACSSDKLEAYAGQPDLNPEAPSNAIQFGTYMGKSTTTRAGWEGSINDDALKASEKANGFGVFAFNTGATAWSDNQSTFEPNFMYNEKVTYNNTDGWNYTPLKYWPNGKDAANGSQGPSNTATEAAIQQISFFAYAPYVEATASTGAVTPNTDGIIAMTANNVKSAPTVDYKLRTTDFHTKANVDLLWGLAGSAPYSETDGTNATKTVGTSYNTDLTKQTVSETVDFLFKHALAKIGGKNGLKIVADFDGNGVGEQGFGEKSATTCITVREIKIKNAAISASNFNIGGTFNLATGAWSNWTTNASDIAIGGIIDEDIKDGTSSTIKMNTDIYNAAGTPEYTSGTSTWSPLGVTTTAKEVYASDATTADAFYLIPGSDSKNALTLTVEVNYDITTADDKINGGYVKINQTITNNVTIPAGLNVNKFYTLVIHLGLTSVKFSATVADWDTAEATATEEVWLPSNVVDQSTAVTMAAGKAATVNTAAATTSYTIHLTGLTASTSHTVTGTGNYSSASGNTSDTEGKASIVVTLTANSTASPVESIITVKEGDTVKAVVTIIQAATA